MSLAGLLFIIPQMIWAQSNNIFDGGIGDGYAEKSFTMPDNNSIFAGGNSDGYALAAYEQDANNAIFSGGNGDGYDETNYEQVVNNSIFAGGVADGYDDAQFSESVNNAIFDGGIADGYDENNYEGPTNNSIFAGGMADGYDENNYAQDFSNNIFAGGNGDVFDENNYEQNTSNSIFAGTRGDGYAGQSTSSATGLPVALLYFKAHKQPEKVKLTWATATERNAKHFEVQKALEGAFTTIITEPAQGNSLTQNRYQAFDDEPHEGHNYYRLKEVDYDGQTQLSEVVSVYYQPATNRQITTYPNPADRYVNIELSGFEEPVQLTLLSATGRTFLEKEYANSDYNAKIHLTLPENMKKGIYILQIQGKESGTTAKTKLVVIKD